MFLLLSFILSLSAIIITLKILVGYNPELSLRKKLSISFLVIVAWFCPTIASAARKLKLLSEPEILYVTPILYAFFIMAVFLLGVLLLRDIFWIHGYQIVKKTGRASSDYDPMRPEAIKKANVAAFIVTLLIAGYSVYEGVKFPAIKETQIVTSKVSSPFKIAVLTDTHITPTTSVGYVEKLVTTVNGLKPDVTVLVGDIIDGKPAALEKQMHVLSALEAKYGVFVTLGNHEFYHGSLTWEEKYKQMGFSYLANNGLFLNEVNVYVSGLPDPQMLSVINQAMDGIKNMLDKAPDGAYRVFLSHSPRFIKKLNKNLIDLQISGHTHGGQIFPFHFFVKRFNDFVAGLYDVDGMNLYISRGVGRWGPPMRLFAPSEISLITLIPSEKKAAD